jgi:hypothetical protein
MPNKRTGQDYIDYYEKKLKETGKTTMGEKFRYTKERAKLNKEAMKKIGK